MSAWAASLLAALVLSTLGGCAWWRGPLETPHALREFQPRFEMSGRLSATDASQAVSLRVEWTHRDDTDVWTFLSPLGQTLARLERNREVSRLITADGQVAVADRPEDLAAHVLGVAVPLAALASWVQAVPREHGRVLTRDAQGRPARVSDAQWIIDYVSYANEAADAAPRRIDAAWGEASLRLLIDHWSFE